MYKCTWCGYECIEPPTNTDEFGQKFEYCPECGQENDFIKLHECEHCQENMILPDEIWCDTCKKNIKNRFISILNSNFNCEEIKYIDVLIDGTYLYELLGYGGDKNV